MELKLKKHKNDERLYKIILMINTMFRAEKKITDTVGRLDNTYPEAFASDPLPISFYGVLDIVYFYGVDGVLDIVYLEFVGLTQKQVYAMFGTSRNDNRPVGWYTTQYDKKGDGIKSKLGFTGFIPDNINNRILGMDNNKVKGSRAVDKIIADLEIMFKDLVTIKAKWDKKHAKKNAKKNGNKSNERSLPRL
jgi:hypothetical protein